MGPLFSEWLWVTQMSLTNTLEKKRKPSVLSHWSSRTSEPLWGELSKTSCLSSLEPGDQQLFFPESKCKTGLYLNDLGRGQMVGDEGAFLKSGNNGQRTRSWSSNCSGALCWLWSKGVTHCCVWGCRAADWSGWPSGPLSKTESASSHAKKTMIEDLFGHPWHTHFHGKWYSLQTVTSFSRIMSPSTKPEWSRKGCAGGPHVMPGVYPLQKYTFLLLPHSLVKESSIHLIVVS